MRAEFKRLIAMRHQHPVLRRVSIEAPLFMDDQVIVWLRGLGGQAALVAVNNGSTPRSLRLTLPPELAAARWYDVLAAQTVSKDAGVLQLTVPALFGTVLATTPP